MITRIVKMTIEPSKIVDFLSFLEKEKEKIRHFNGCKHLEILKEKNSDHIVFSYSIWESEYHLEQYRKSDIFKFIWSNAKAFFTDRAQAWTVENVFESPFLTR